MGSRGLRSSSRGIRTPRSPRQSVSCPCGVLQLVVHLFADRIPFGTRTVDSADRRPRRPADMSVGLRRDAPRRRGAGGAGVPRLVGAFYRRQRDGGGRLRERSGSAKDASILSQGRPASTRSPTEREDTVRRVGGGPHRGVSPARRGSPGGPMTRNGQGRDPPIVSKFRSSSDGCDEDEVLTAFDMEHTRRKLVLELFRWTRRRVRDPFSVAAPSCLARANLKTTPSARWFIDGVRDRLFDSSQTP